MRTTTENLRDGADIRKDRLRQMLAFIRTNGGSTTEEIKAFMSTKFGLKFDTTAGYMREMHIAGLIQTTQGKWFTTGKYDRSAGLLY